MAKGKKARGQDRARRACKELGKVRVEVPGINGIPRCWHPRWTGDLVPRSFPMFTPHSQFLLFKICLSALMRGHQWAGSETLLL